MNIIFMGTPSFAIPALEKIKDADYNILSVYTQAPKKAGRGKKIQKSPIHLRAEDFNIPVKIPPSLKQAEIIEEIKSAKPDIIIVAAYGMLLPKEILEIAKFGCLNIHPSLLPRWRGAAPIERTIMAGDKKTGICIMQMDVGLDSGDILKKIEIDLSGRENAKELHDKLSVKGAEILLEVLDDFKNNKKISAKKQSEEDITYAKKIDKKEKEINWQLSAKQIDANIRGLMGGFFIDSGKRIKILECSFDENFKHKLSPGTIIDSKFNIACKTGKITPTIIQKEGNKSLPIEEFLKGFRK